MSKGSSAFATIVGRLGRDPETRQAGNSQVASFSVAATSGWGANEKTTWFDISIFGNDTQMERVTQFLVKGSKVLIHGELSLHTWDNRTTGEKQSSIKVTVGFSGYWEALDSKEERDALGGRSAGSSQSRGANREDRTNPQDKPRGGNGGSGTFGGGWGDPDLDDDVPF